jgi:hypothetical protein
VVRGGPYLLVAQLQLIELTPQLAHLGALAGDLLAE